MKRLTSCLPILLVVLPMFPGAAEATPRVALSVRAAPVSRSPTIPELGDVPRTGNLAGAGAELEITLTISGEEYFGYPPPLEKLRVQLAPGIVWNPHGVATCNTQFQPPIVSELMPRCSPKTLAGTFGAARATVAFGASFLPESLSVHSYYARGGGLDLNLMGDAPVRIEVVTTGVVTRRGTRRELTLSLPLTETQPGGPAVSLTTLAFHAGSALGTNGHRGFSLRMPRSCPGRGLRFEAEAVFAAVAGLPVRTASAEFRAPCPRGSMRRGSASG